MKIKKIEEKETITKFTIKGTNVQFVNAIRRAIMNSVPVLAISSITIYDNTSIFFDELMASRLGLLPLKTNKTYKIGDKVTLSLEAEGPGDVFSGEINCHDPSVEVFQKEIPLFKLSEGQKIKVEMHAEVKTGKTHSKWQAGIAAYSQIPIINAKATDLNKIKEKTPNAVIELKNGTALIDPYECSAHAIAEKTNGKLTYDETQFLFYIETHGSTNNREILERATLALEDKCKEFKEALKKAK